MSRTLTEGSPAPAFERADHTGRLWRSAELLGRWVVIFFYPRDFTPACTAQSCAFRDATPRLAAKGAVILGVSGDDAASHARFIQTHQLPYPLISDADGSLAKLFGVRRSLLGLLPGRETIVINPQGKIAMVFRSATQAQEHAARALKTVESATA